MMNLNDRKTGLFCVVATISLLLSPIISIGIKKTEGQGLIGALSDNKVVLYYSFDNMDNVGKDDSGKGRDINLVSGAKQTGNGLYGGNLYFNGESDYTMTNAHSSFHITEDLTIEAWVNYEDGDGVGGSRGTIVMEKGHFRLHISKDNDKVRFESGNPYWDYVQSHSSIPENEWTHIAVTRDGDGTDSDSIKIYINGMLDVHGEINEYSKPDGTSEDAIYIGSWEGYNHFFPGYIDEVRISNVVREVGGTIAFWNFNEGAGNVVRNRSPIGDYIVGQLRNMDDNDWVSGRYGTGLEFDGLNDYVDVGAHYILRPDIITVETWIYPTATGHQYIIDGADHLSSPKGGYFLRIQDDNEIEFRIYTSGSTHVSVTSTTTISANNWYQIAGIFDGSTLALYVNGVCEDTVSYSGSIHYEQYVGMHIGSNVDPYRFFQGIIDEVRISNYGKQFRFDDGNALGTDQGDYGADVLYLPFEGTDLNGDEDDGILDDKTPYDNDITYSTGVDITNGKYGGGLYFDGHSDFIQRSTLPDSLEPDVISVEAWIYPKATGHQYIIDAADHIYSSYGGYFLRIKDDNKIEFRIYTTWGNSNVFSTTQIEINNWYHIAGVYDGYALRLYINRICEDIVLIDENMKYSYDYGLNIGRSNGNCRFFKGIIDEVRISNYPRSFHEDTDGDGMSDMYEIMRSVNSNQYNPKEHNGRHSVLMCWDDEDNSNAFWKALTFTYSSLKALGYHDEDIRVLNKNDPPSSGTYADIVDDIINDNSIETAMNEINSISTSSDFIFIYGTDHGYVKDDYTQSFIKWDDNNFYYDDDLANDVNRISNYRTMVILLDYCYAAGFMDDLSDINEDRVIMTASPYNLGGWMKSNGIQYLTNSFIGALSYRNFYADKINADTDIYGLEDGFVSVSEAYNYAFDKALDDNPKNYYMYDDNGIDLDISDVADNSALYNPTDIHSEEIPNEPPIEEPLYDVVGNKYYWDTVWETDHRPNILSNYIDGPGYHGTVGIGFTSWDEGELGARTYL